VPHPSDGATVGVAAPEAAIVEHPIEEFAHELPASRGQRPPRRDWISLQDDEQVGLAAVAVRAVLEDSIRHGRTPPRSGSGSGSGGYFRHPTVHCLELAVVPGPAARLVHPESMEEMSLALPPAAADAVEMLRRASICRYNNIWTDRPVRHIMEFFCFFVLLLSLVLLLARCFRFFSPFYSLHDSVLSETRRRRRRLPPG
jgi:hypothetical protein